VYIYGRIFELPNLCQIASELEKKKVNLQVIEQNIDTSNATNRLLFNMLGAIAQFETEIQAERQMDGIQKAKERGAQFGRKKELDDEQVRELREMWAQGVLIKDLMEEYKLSKKTDIVGWNLHACFRDEIHLVAQSNPQPSSQPCCPQDPLQSLLILRG
jgi:DNA invertase Pin-like site-specific DNA recombinase